MEGCCPSEAVVIEGGATISLSTDAVGRGYFSVAEPNWAPKCKGILDDAVCRVSLPWHGAGQGSEGNGFR